MDKLNEDISRVEKEIASIQQYIDKNSQVSTNKFDENDEVNKGLVFNKDIYKYDPATGNFTQDGKTGDANKGGAYGQYGLLGAAFVKHYNMMLDLVSMPYP